MQNNKPLNEALKEFGRIFLLGILPVLATALESGTLFTYSTVVMLAIASLRAIDAYIHERKDIKANGLVPF